MSTCPVVPISYAMAQMETTRSGPARPLHQSDVHHRTSHLHPHTHLALHLSAILSPQLHDGFMMS